MVVMVRGPAENDPRWKQILCKEEDDDDDNNKSSFISAGADEREAVRKEPEGARRGEERREAPRIGQPIG